MKFSKGYAQIDGKWCKIEYPFKRTIRRVKRGFKLINNDNLEKLIIEEYTIMSQKKGKVVDNKFSYTVWLPKSIYRFKRFITKETL